VLQTESLWFDSAEGVRVTYDKRRVAFDALLERAQTQRCDLFVWTTTPAQQKAAREAVGERAQRFEDVPARDRERRDKEQHYYLFKSPLRRLPMTAAQATKVNAALRGGGDAYRAYLSPGQLAWLKELKDAPKKPWPVAQGVPMAAAVRAFLRVRSR